jgi:hypothetical protein
MEFKHFRSPIWRIFYQMDKHKTLPFDALVACETVIVIATN